MYVAQAVQGDNRWWKYLLSVAAIFISFLLGQIPLTLFFYFKKAKLGLSDELFLEYWNSLNYSALRISENTFFFLIMNTFLFSFCVVVFILPKLHKRIFLSFITSRQKFDFQRLVVGLFTWLILACCITFPLLEANQYEFTFQLSQFIPLTIIALLFVPMQSATEEIVYRGFLMQGVFKLTGNKWLTLFIITFLFALSHAFNPEFKSGFLTIISAYLIFSFTLSYITLADQGLEISIGIHTGNNLFVALILSATEASITTPSIFRTTLSNLIDILPTLLCGLSVLSFIFFKLVYKWKLKL